MGSDNDIKRRLRVLEGVVGIDLDLSPCSGDPMNCTANPCDETRCPMRNNLVNEVGRIAARAEREVVFLRHVVQELAALDQIDPKVVGVAQLRAKEERLLDRKAEVEVVLLANPDSIILQEQVKDLEAKLADVRQQIQAARAKEAKA